MCRPTNHKGKSQWVLKGHKTHHVLGILAEKSLAPTSMQ